MRNLICIKDRLILFGSDIHQRGYSFIIVWRHQPIQITELNHRTNIFIRCNSTLGECLINNIHVLRLNFHSQSPGHCHIKTEFQWNTASGLMILVRTYVRCHSNSRKETGNSPLHINSLQSIRIITRPELIKIRKQSIIDAGTATST